MAIGSEGYGKVVHQLETDKVVGEVASEAYWCNKKEASVSDYSPADLYKA